MKKLSSFMLAVLLSIGIGAALITSASATHDSAKIHACVDSKTGAVLRLVAFPQLCDAKEVLVEWSLDGPAGPPGPPGPPGTANAGRMVLPGSALNPPVELPIGQDVTILQIPLPAGAYVEGKVGFTFLFTLPAGISGLLGGSLRCADISGRLVGDVIVNPIGGLQAVSLEATIGGTPMILIDDEVVEIFCTNTLTIPNTGDPVDVEVVSTKFDFELGDLFLLEEVLAN